LSRRRATGFGLYDALGIARDDKAARSEQMLRNFRFFDAPVGLFITFSRRMSVGTFMDVGMFIENILIGARGEGLHTCGQVAWCSHHKMIREELGHRRGPVAGLRHIHWLRGRGCTGECLAHGPGGHRRVGDFFRRMMAASTPDAGQHFALGAEARFALDREPRSGKIAPHPAGGGIGCKRAARAV
jgi:hypothetical protein